LAWKGREGGREGGRDGLVERRNKCGKKEDDEQGGRGGRREGGRKGSSAYQLCPF